MTSRIPEASMSATQQQQQRICNSLTKTTMHPYGGTPICPRCSRSVYAAEQIMGPGRKLYHKACLTCTTCRKRLDSYNLVEHDQEPYCKQCHIKNFGTRDLRHANLPDRNDVFTSPPTSPSRPAEYLPQTSSPPSSGHAPSLPPRTMSPPIFRPNRALSPTRFAGAERTISSATEQTRTTNGATLDDDDWDPPVIHNNTPSHAGRSAGGLPRTVALDSTMTGPLRAASPAKEQPPASPVRAVRPTSTGGSAASPESPLLGGRMTMPLTPTRTGPGARYGAAFGARTGSPMTPMSTGRTWGSPGGNPVCGKCGKTVYFAEQVKAIGRTWHKNCLRCTECNKSLDSTRLTENEGNPFCNHCYGKLYGPAGSGYALLGKAGG